MRSVVLICLDSVGADDTPSPVIDPSSLTPRMDQFAQSGTLYQEASATAMGAAPSVASILSGAYPLELGVYGQLGSAIDAVDPLPESVHTLAEAFRERGSHTGAFVMDEQLSEGSGFDQGFDLYSVSGGPARLLIHQALEWLAAKEDESVFLFLHFAFPVDATTQPSHDEALAALDQELGALFGQVEEGGSLEEAIVCVVSSHATKLQQRGTPTPDLTEARLQVPWILRVPGEAPRVVSKPCSLVDVYPTLLSAAGAEASEITSGVDRFLHPNIMRPALAEHFDGRSYQQSMRFGDRKVLRRLRWPAAETPLTRDLLLSTLELEAQGQVNDGVEVTYESYDLGDDPREETPLLSTQIDPAFEKSVANQFTDLLTRRKWSAGH